MKTLPENCASCGKRIEKLNGTIVHSNGKSVYCDPHGPSWNTVKIS